MGHDIYLRGLENREVGYLRRSAFNPDRHDIYKIMGFDHDGDCSGDGSSEILCAEDYLDESLKWIKKAKQSDLKKFFRQLHKQLEEYGQVIISFC